MAFLDLLIIFMLSQLIIVHQIHGYCYTDVDHIYNICNFDSLNNILELSKYREFEYDDDYDYHYNARNLPYKIKITNSNIPTLKSDYFNTNNIEVLVVSGNNISFVDLYELPLLYKLDLSHNSVHQMDIVELNSLKELDISFNNISDISANLFQFPENIVYINASNNRIQNLFQISTMPQLNKLDLSYNYINHISKECFYNLHLLELLIISNNNISILESGIFLHLRSLKYLNLSHNHIRLLEHSIVSGDGRLRILDLSYNNVNNISKTFFNELTQLVVLNISNNNITTMESGIYTNLKLLKHLDLSNNRIKILQFSSLPELGTLDSLDLSYNNIHLVSKINSKKINLFSLNLSNNNITILESDIFQNLKLLNYLDLSHNHIKLLEYSSLNGLVRLDTLVLNNNYITSIPSMVFYNSWNLRTLYLKSNRLIELEYDILLYLSSLTNIDFDENLMSCETINDLLKQFRIRNIRVARGSLNCTRTNESTSRQNFPIELILKYYSDFNTSGIIKMFNDLESNLNSTIIKDFVANIMDPYGMSNLESILRNLTHPIKKYEEVGQPNEMYVDIMDKLNNTFLDITVKSEKAKDDVISLINDIKEMFKIISNERMKILKNIVDAEEKNLRDEIDLKLSLQEMLLKFEEILNKLNTGNEITTESEEISSDNFLYILLLLLLITVLFMVHIYVQIFNYKNAYNKKFISNELQSII